MNVLDSLSNNSIDTGIFAMENAQGGVVIESVEALAKNQCQIIDMFFHLEFVWGFSQKNPDIPPLSLFSCDLFFNRGGNSDDEKYFSFSNYRFLNHPKRTNSKHQKIKDEGHRGQNVFLT